MPLSIRKAIADAGRENIPITDAESVLAHILCKDISFLWAHPEHLLNETQTATWEEALKKLRRNFSPAHIKGVKEFFGLKFSVTPAVLVPRPETEILAEKALEEISSGDFKAVFDIGTGCGNIAISVRKHLPRKFSSLPIYASDISEEALSLARGNAAALKAENIVFRRGSLLHPWRKRLSRLGEEKSKFLLLANLPYLDKRKKEEILAVPEAKTLSREPAIALWAEEGGLALYRDLFREINQFAQGARLCLICEIDPSQAETITALAEKTFAPNLSGGEIWRDLAGRKRFFSTHTSPTPSDWD